MSKKNYRQSRPTTAATSTPRPATSIRSTSSPTASEQFNPDYTYVRKDLKRIGLLAGIFLSFLVVLSFFLR